MKLSRSFRKLGRQMEEAVGLQPSAESRLLRNVGLATAGVTVVALGVVVGRELRQRYKFNRRTPYDAYSRSGNSRASFDQEEVEFGLGV